MLCSLGRGLDGGQVNSAVIHADFTGKVTGKHQDVAMPLPQIRFHDQGPKVQQIVEAFARAARGGKDPVFTLENSVKNQKVIDAIFRAGKSDVWEKV